jgi:TPP-dependent pyruvate/acetoin dehydrogenase alpha subunit
MLAIRCIPFHEVVKSSVSHGFIMQAYMQGNIRGFMHLDNGQETIPAMCALTLKPTDIKYSYYREHTHALASGVSANKIMAELFAKIDGTCKGAGGSMHIYDVDTHFQGGWALVAEQLPYAVGAARSILLDRHLNPDKHKGDDRISVVFIGERFIKLRNSNR